MTKYIVWYKDGVEESWKDSWLSGTLYDTRHAAEAAQQEIADFLRQQGNEERASNWENRDQQIFEIQVPLPEEI